MNTLKTLQSKKSIPKDFFKKEIYKYPFEILNNLSKEEKEYTLNQIKIEYNKYFSEEIEIAKQYWKSMYYISLFLNDESKKNLLNNEEMMNLLDNYKSEEEMNQIENEIKKNMNSPEEDTKFWKDSYDLLKYLKNKKLLEDLYNNFINNQRINHNIEIIEEKENEEDEEQEEINNIIKSDIKSKNMDKIENKNYIDNVDDIEDDNNIDIEEAINDSEIKMKKKKKKELTFRERYNIINEDLEKIRYNQFLNEESDENINNDDENTEEDLSPPKYDSDEELSKKAINQVDYFANLNANRKKILQIKIEEYKENQKNQEINKKNKIKNKDKNTKTNKNKNEIIKTKSINLEESDEEKEEKNIIKKKPNSFLDFIMNQKANSKKEKEKLNVIKEEEENEDDKDKIKSKKKIKEKDEIEDNNEDKESDQEALNFLQKISGHKKNKNNNLLTSNEDYNILNKNKKEINEETPEENAHLSEFQKTIQNFDKYLDKNDISGVYTNLEIIENTFRDLEKNTDNELVFNDIVEVKKEYEWSKEYKPIKPRYSNKKIVGFDWNRYNQAHYDNDNLPPKTVNGYRFNIFYPNLVDKTKTPKFYLQRSETPDMCIIRFESGAPYEDVAFKIINREWNTRVKGDFLNIFDKGVLKLYFKFKRFRYKR